MPLSPRLQSLLDRCEPGLPLWDLCCDHGLLGLHALQSGRFAQVIFNDAVPHVTAPLQAKWGANEGVRVICALAEDIGEPLTGNVVIAGVGGEKIFKILSTHASRSRLAAEKIIVCPEKDAEWLAAQPVPGYHLVESLSIMHGRGGSRTILTYLRGDVAK